jgi:hypothetical protein
VSLSCNEGFESSAITLPGITIRVTALIDFYVQRQDVRRTDDPML